VRHDLDAHRLGRAAAAALRRDDLDLAPGRYSFGAHAAVDALNLDGPPRGNRPVPAELRPLLLALRGGLRVARLGRLGGRRDD
jgi:hypothetical protein